MSSNFFVSYHKIKKLKESTQYYLENPKKIKEYEKITKEDFKKIEEHLKNNTTTLPEIQNLSEDERNALKNKTRVKIRDTTKCNTHDNVIYGRYLSSVMQYPFNVDGKLDITENNLCISWFCFMIYFDETNGILYIQNQYLGITGNYTGLCKTILTAISPQNRYEQIKCFTPKYCSQIQSSEDIKEIIVKSTIPKKNLEDSNEINEENAYEIVFKKNQSQGILKAFYEKFKSGDFLPKAASDVLTNQCYMEIDEENIKGLDALTTSSGRIVLLGHNTRSDLIRVDLKISDDKKHPCYADWKIKSLSFLNEHILNNHI